MRLFAIVRRHVPASLLAAIVVAIVAAGVTPAGAGTGPRAGAGTPPPVPTLEKRAQLIAAEREAWEQGIAPATPEEALLPAPARAVHDEYDVTNYEITLGLDIPNHVINGVVTVQARSQVANLTQISLDLYSCMNVDAVTVDGVAATWSHPGSLLTVALGHAHQPGETFSVTATYHGTPLYTGTPFRWNTQGGVPMVLSYSEPYGSPAWWVCKDDPKDKATFTLHITVPSTLYAVSNGLLTGVVDHGDGTSTYTWATGYPMSPYLFSIAVTDYAKWTETYTALDGTTTMDVDYYAYRSDSLHARASWGRNIGMMEYYASIFGEYPFLTERYGIAEFAHPGAMEHQTCTSMGAAWITGNDANDDVVAHELSHAWVGDMITMRTWSHAWCKEGFATYCEALYFEDLYGTDYYHEYMASIPGLTYGGYRIFNMSPPLHAAIYYKGGWVLHMLRHVIGDAAFFQAIRDYTNDPDFRYGVADTEDLRAAFEAASGMDLAWFFEQWIYQPGYPMYELYWWPQPARDGYDVNVQIRQVQSSGPIFKMPIDVSVRTAVGEQSSVVWDSLQTQHFVLHVDSEPAGVELDPDVWILREIELMSDVAGAGAGADVALAPRNEPNPFAGTTRIEFDLATAGRATLDIYDAAGRRVTRVLDGLRPAGAQRVAWNGTDDHGRPVPAGTYFYELRAQGAQLGGRMLLLR
jgi:aminopeptidase N